MEKTLERDTYFSRTLSQTEQKMRYDEAVKEILANKIVLAHILKGCVEEYEGCNIEEIKRKVRFNDSGYDMFRFGKNEYHI